MDVKIGNKQYIAWDKLLQKILKVQQLDFAEWWVQCYKEDGDIAIKPEDIQKYGERNSFNNEETDRHILLPYTGKTDCEGQPIYNLDLIEENGHVYLVQIFTESYYLYRGEEIHTPLKCGCLKGKRIGSVYESVEYCRLHNIKRTF